jgi:hypothetical protein
LARKFEVTAAIAGSIAVLGILLVAPFAWDYLDRDSVPQQSIKYQLALFGLSIYEYHSTTGRWPARLDDLARTSLSRRNPHWRLSATPFVILWRDDLRPDPKDNAAVVLAYHNAGVLANLGRKWVLWGDLRTEYVRTATLRAILDKQDH